jgi:hypothetical protein
LSALIPGVLAMIQGVGSSNDNCNKTDIKNNTIIDVKQIPNFSVSVYFLLMFVILMICGVSFAILNYSKIGINARKNELNQMIALDSELNEDDIQESQMKSKEIKREILILFIITYFGSFVNYGFLPGIMSFSTLPYGPRCFHLSVNLACISLPVVILASIWSYNVSVLRIAIEFIITIIFSLYILTISILSPCPFFIHNGFGEFMIIFSWIITGALNLRIRLLTATRLEAFGDKVLLNYGFMTILGQMIGICLILYIS